MAFVCKELIRTYIVILWNVIAMNLRNTLLVALHYFIGGYQHFRHSCLHFCVQDKMQRRFKYMQTFQAIRSPAGYIFFFTDISTKHLLWYAVNKQALHTCSRGIPYSECEQCPKKALQGQYRTAADWEPLCWWILFSTDSGVTEVSIMWELRALFFVLVSAHWHLKGTWPSSSEMKAAFSSKMSVNFCPTIWC